MYLSLSWQEGLSFPGAILPCRCTFCWRSDSIPKAMPQFSKYFWVFLKITSTAHKSNLLTHVQMWLGLFDRNSNRLTRFPQRKQTNPYYRQACPSSEAVRTDRLWRGKHYGLFSRHSHTLSNFCAALMLWARVRAWLLEATWAGAKRPCGSQVQHPPAYSKDISISSSLHIIYKDLCKS